MTKSYGPAFDRIDKSVLQRLETRNAAPVAAVPTPFATWNRACRDQGGGQGLALGWHVIIAGATGAGKSLLALNMVATALRSGEAVVYISLEMSQEQLLTRLIACLTGNDVRWLEPGSEHKRDVERQAHGEFLDVLEQSGGKLYVNQHTVRSLTDIDMVFGWYTDKEPCTVFVTDYLQLAWAVGAQNILQNITEVSHTIRARARDHRVLSIGLSQFNRQTSSQREERPRPEGLMGGSPLENDADQVLMIDHTSYEHHGPSATSTKLLLGKNRHGPQVEIPVMIDKKTLRITQDTTSGAT